MRGASVTRRPGPKRKDSGENVAGREPSKPRKLGRGFSFSLWVDHHQQSAVDSLARLFSQFFSSLLTWTVIGIALSLPLCLSLLVTNLQQLGAGIDQSARISVYLEEDAGEEAISEALALIESRDDVASATHISAADGLEEFQAATGFEDVLAGLDDNPLPAVIQVTPASVAADLVDELRTALEALPVTESVVLDMAWVQRLNAILSLVKRLTIGLAVLLCLGVLLVIGNTVRLSIENRRSEIVVVKLVGGTNAWVARPFLYTGLWYGVGGGVIAAIVVTGGLFLLSGPVASLAGLYSYSFRLTGWSVSNILIVVLGSGVLGWMGAWLSVVRHLKAIEPR